MSKSPTPVDDTVTTGSQHTSAHEAELRNSDPDLANEIYGTTAEKAAGTVTTGQPTPPEEAPPGEPAPTPTPADPPAAPAPVAATPPADPATPTPGSASTPMVPLARLNEVLGRLDAVTQQLEASKAGGAPAAPAEPAQPATPAAPEFDLKAKLKEKLQAQWDGNEERVVEIELEIEEHRQAQATAAAVAAVQQDRAQSTLTTTLAQVGEQIVTDFPQLDNRKEGHNPEAIAAFKAERDVQIAAGKAPDVAMRRAATLVAMDYGLQKATSATPPPAAHAAPSGVDPVTARVVDVARIAAQTANTPPNNVGGRGQGDLAPEQKIYSRDEWLRMDERQKNEALGIE